MFLSFFEKGTAVVKNVCNIFNDDTSYKYQSSKIYNHERR